MIEKSNFKQKVIAAVHTVPYGKVASYGQIALMVGIPRAARQVGWTLNRLETDLFRSNPDIPWWRIVNNQGRISIKGTKYHDAPMQKHLLEKEGIFIKDDLTFDIEEYRYRPTPEEVNKLKLDDEYVAQLLKKYSSLQL